MQNRSDLEISFETQVKRFKNKVNCTQSKVASVESLVSYPSIRAFIGDFEHCAITTKVGGWIHLSLQPVEFTTLNSGPLKTENEIIA